MRDQSLEGENVQKNLVLTDWLSGLNKALPAEGMVGFFAVERGRLGRNEDRVDIYKDLQVVASFQSRARMEVEVSPVRNLLPHSLQLWLPEIQDLSELGSILISKGG